MTTAATETVEREEIGPTLTGTMVDGKGTVAEDVGDAASLGNANAQAGGHAPAVDPSLAAARERHEAGKGVPGQPITSPGDPSDGGAPAG